MFLTFNAFNAFNTVNDGNLPEDIINNNAPARQNRMRLIANPNEADHNYQINTITDQRQVDFEHYLQLADKLVKSIPLDYPPV